MKNQMEKCGSSVGAPLNSSETPNGSPSHHVPLAVSRDFHKAVYVLLNAKPREILPCLTRVRIAFEAHAAALNGQPKISAEPWCPDFCPITNLPFFMWIEHPELGMVPTYGGPLDSYTLAERDEDGGYMRLRYDHDTGAWDEWEVVPVVVKSDQDWLKLEGVIETLSAENARLKEQLSEVEGGGHRGDAESAEKHD